MKTIAVIYHPVDYNQVEQLKSLLTEKKLEQRNLKPCNLWLPFDFHLYQEGLKYRPSQTKLSEQDIHDLAHNEFAWLADYFEFDSYTNLERIIANKGYFFEQLKKEFPNYSDEQLLMIEKQNLDWISSLTEKIEIMKIYYKIQLQWTTIMYEDYQKKLDSGCDILIVSQYTSKAIDALNDKMHYNTFYFIEPDSEKTGIEYLTEQYAILKEEEEINNAYLEENRAPDEITQQSKKIKQKILLPAPLLDKKITPII